VVFVVFAFFVAFMAVVMIVVDRDGDREQATRRKHREDRESNPSANQGAHPEGLHGDSPEQSVPASKHAACAIHRRGRRARWRASKTILAEAIDHSGGAVRGGADHDGALKRDVVTRRP
jgi:hypothetical protein